MIEKWEYVEEFPLYCVSNYGIVINTRTTQVIKQHVSPQGVVFVSLYGNNQQNTRSVKLLVANAFVSGRSDLCSEPMNLDGDRTNNRADNIVWRPHWFVIKYMNQFNNKYEHEKLGPIVDEETKNLWDTVKEASIANGVLMRDIVRSCHVGGPVFPTDQTFTVEGDLLRTTGPFTVSY